MAFSGTFANYLFTGLLLDSFGNVVPNAPVQIQLTDFNNGTNHGNGSWLGMTGPNGNYTVTAQLPNDVNSMTAVAFNPADPNTTRDAVQGTGTGTTSPVAMSAASQSSGLGAQIERTVAGRVADKNGNGISGVPVGFWVTVSYPGGSTLTASGSATTDANGFWNVTLMLPANSGAGTPWSWFQGQATATLPGKSQLSGGQLILPYPANVGAYPTVRCHLITMG